MRKDVRVAVAGVGRDTRSQRLRAAAVRHALLSGMMSRLLSTRTLFVVAALDFTGASAMCTTATTLGQMIVYRAVQGRCGGAMTSTVWAALLPAPASAQLNCWWNGIGMQCQPGWSWNAQQRREERREDRREGGRERRDEEREAPRQQEQPQQWCRSGGLWYRC
jgi:hypothetical protein